MKVREMGWLNTSSCRRFRRGKGAQETDDAGQKEQQKARMAPNWMTMVYIFQ